MGLENVCFNTQPPEGGWWDGFGKAAQLIEFQHTAARRRLGDFFVITTIYGHVSTHSRPKAAGSIWPSVVKVPEFQHTAARRRLGESWEILPDFRGVSTHSRPKAAGTLLKVGCKKCEFQHTAARRRLVPLRNRRPTA